MSFEVFKAGQPRVSKVPRIGLSRHGYFSVNRTAYELLGRPSRVVLMYDAERELVALEPAGEDTPHSYKVVQQGKSQSYIVAAKAFCDHYEIAYGDEVLHFTPRKEGGLLIFELA